MIDYGTSMQEILNELFDGVYIVDSKKRIVFWNKSAESVTGYRASEVLGKSCADNILGHLDVFGRSLCDDRCPLERTLHDGGCYSENCFIQHREGHRFFVSLRTVPIFGKDGATIGAAELFNDFSTKGERVQRREDFVDTDPITGAKSRSFVEMALHSKLEDMKRYGWGFGIIFIDIDNIEDIRENFGNKTGDRLVKMVLQTLSRCARSYDVVGRWGEMEMLMIVSNIKEEQLTFVSDRLRALVGNSKLHTGSETIKATISLGATFVHTADTATSILKRADALLNESKLSGGNKTTCR